ncbi:hypothetical protein LshimejAT787_0505730 [Lyophyllum shimeji]|uniref:Uncharacterized protein n=1 Tax=Lyophyllum shimeji TaxID=47721 RepID=A0A9P3UMJ1_LYOSH|nr:hypothetical protein LshimejAT787_0505730 [Lyophyllum shimeji]
MPVLAVVAVVVPLAVVFTTAERGRLSSASAGSGVVGPDLNEEDAGFGTTGSEITMDDGTALHTPVTSEEIALTIQDALSAVWGEAQRWRKRAGMGEQLWGEVLLDRTFRLPCTPWAAGDNLAKEMEENYSMSITEKGFAAITAAGLNWVRISSDSEPLRQLTTTSRARWGHHGNTYGMPSIGHEKPFRDKSNSRLYARVIIGTANAKHVVPIVAIVSEILLGTNVDIRIIQYHALAAVIHSSAQRNGRHNRRFLAGADRVVLDQHLYG